MRKIRRFLTVLLFINFFAGMAQGMKPLNLGMVIVNGILVIALADEEKRWLYGEKIGCCKEGSQERGLEESVTDSEGFSHWNNTGTEK